MSIEPIYIPPSSASFLAMKWRFAIIIFLIFSKFSWVVDADGRPELGSTSKDLLLSLNSSIILDNLNIRKDEKLM